MKEYTSVRQLTEDLPALALPHRESLRGSDGLFAFALQEGDTYFIRLQEGLLTVSEHAEASPVCTVHAKEEDLLAMLAGRLNPAKALLWRKVRIQGNSAALLSLLKLL